MATLIITEGPCEGQQFSLGNHRLVMIGRDDSCNFQIVDPEMSRRHFQVKYDPSRSGHSLIDAGSANGVFIGGQKIEEEVPLLEGDEIGAGGTRILYTAHDSPDAATIASLLRSREERGRSTLLRDGAS